MNWIKTNIANLLIILLAVLYGLKNCDGFFKGNPTPKADTVFTTRTEYIQQPAQIVPQYIPMPASTQVPVVIPQQYKPDTTLHGVLRQYMEVLDNYLAKNNYIDSVILKDTAGNRVGVIKLEDQISENKFVYRKPSYQLSFPVTTNTITITKPAKKRNELYFGGLLEGSSKDVLNAVGVGALLKNKKDAIWGLSAKYQFANQAITYEISRYWKLSFRKQ